MSHDDTRPVALTAQWTAMARSVESQRPDAMFHDPWAELLAGKSGAGWLELQPPEHPGLRIALRTRFFDDFFEKHMSDGEPRQVVLLAAGYDTRAFRLAWPAGTTLFEIDQPAVLARKDDILRQAQAQPQCTRITIGMDLSFQWTAPLLAAGFQPDTPSIWLIEGLLMYLAPEDARQVVATVTQLASVGSWLGVDLLNPATLTSPLTRDRIERLANRGMPWQFGVDDPHAWLDSQGWDAQVMSMAEVGRQYGRWPYPPVSSNLPPDQMPSSFLVTAKRQE
ncbi:MAG TPA: SAM-dependent methyltransferase [Ktedonobacterales bacterium]|nr:SAM-dependent methyltransferase [Ktedonobacterales bacterium]